MDYLNQRFPMFLCLPPELRVMIFTKMTLAERAQMARASAQALQYFQWHRVAVTDVYVYVSPNCDSPSINVNFDNDYEERHILPVTQSALLELEHASYSGCECGWCTDEKILFNCTPEFKSRAKVQSLTWKSFEAVIDTVFLTQPETIHIRTSPYGGLVDCFQPMRILRRNTVVDSCLCFWWHGRNTDRTVPESIHKGKWGKWIEFSSSNSIWLRTPYGLKQFGEVQDWSTCAVIHRDILDLNEVKNLKSLHVHGSSPISLQQLSSLNCDQLVLFGTALSGDELGVYFLEKIKKWIATDKECRFWIHMDSCDGSRAVEALDDYLSKHPLPDHIKTREDPPLHIRRLRNEKSGRMLEVMRHGVFTSKI